MSIKTTFQKVKNFFSSKPEPKKKIIIDPLATSIIDPFDKIKIRNLYLWGVLRKHVYHRKFVNDINKM